MVVKRAAEQTGRQPCWSPRLGRVPQLQTGLRQFGRHDEAELCEAAASGPGERHIQRLPVPGRRDPPDYCGFRARGDQIPWRVLSPHLAILARFAAQALAYCQMGSVGLIEYPSAAK